MSSTIHIVAVGIQELDTDSLFSLREMVPEATLHCCTNELEWRLILSRHRPDAMLLFQPLRGNGIASLIDAMHLPPGMRVPLFLCGLASELSLGLQGAFTVYRFASPIPPAKMLRQVLNLPPQPSADGAGDSPARVAPPADSLPRFLGGITHDFNNLLAVIMGEVQLAASRSREPAVSAHLARANDACFRMATEIRKLLVFQESNAEKRGMLDLRQLLRDARRFVPESLGSHATVEIEETPEPLWVDATFSGLRQILLNLCGYALRRAPQAIVRVSATKVPGARSPGHVLMEVSTSGMPPSPYEWPTTEPMVDAGVGLAIAWELVQDFGGSISSLQESDGMLSFRIMLPLAHPSSQHASGQLNALRGTESLLVLSTERPSAESFARDVRSLGYSVQVLSNLDSLPALFHEGPLRANAAILDADCDGLDPAQAHNALRALAPRMPILLAAHDIARQCRPPFSHDALTCLVHKPLDLRETLSSVRAMAGTPRFAGSGWSLLTPDMVDKP